MLNKYSIILFDMDGTIADTDQMIVETFLYLYDKYREGRRTPLEEIYYFSGPPIRETIQKEFPGYDVDLVLSDFREKSISLYPSTVKAYEDSREVLLNLKKLGYKLGVVTNKSSDPARYCLRLLNFEDIFDVCIGYNDVKVGKPDPEGILKAIELLGEKDVKKAIYVGDNKVDIVSAENAGIDNILVTWGPRKVDPTINPTYKVGNFKELEEIFINGK